MSDAFLLSTASMGTVVTIHIVGGAASSDRAAHHRAAERALGWFREVERVCSRFEPTSEVSQLSSRAGEAVPASPMLFAATHFALAVAEETGGAFDPTLGSLLEAAGFNHEHRSGWPVRIAPATNGAASFRDIELDADAHTITLVRPLLLDLGAVAKGLAIDMAAKELDDNGYENFAVDAGGDLYFAGNNAAGEPWSVGLRHPRREADIIEEFRVSNSAVCTSGDYERRAVGGGDNTAIEHHIVDPRTGTSAKRCASVTTLAPSAMVADALGTAAFVLGPIDGLALLERHGLDAVIITPALERTATAGVPAAGGVYRGESPTTGRMSAG
ncbi:MAG TPA: FAD:protein FMN transferase [Gemmatimonadaceae bacterium]|nr:FAD:protein FMN transferase [Gemmatimonadaceae bacterium]